VTLVILAVAGALGGTLLLCCGGCTVLGLIGSRSPHSKQAKRLAEADGGAAPRDVQRDRSRAVLTEEYYPFTPGSVRQALMVLSIQRGKFEIWTQKEITYREGGEIAFKGLSRKGIEKGSREETDMPITKESSRQYRKKDGYIEIGHENVAGMIWYPIVKLGAKAGDEWERAYFDGGSKVRYRLVMFDTEEFAWRKWGVGEPVDVAVIEMRLTTTLGDGKGLEDFQEFKLGYGIGPVRTKSWRVEEGERIENWSENLVPIR